MLNDMKILSILLLFICVSAYAEECTFDETAYVTFINKYSRENQNSKIESDGKTLRVIRNNEDILVKGGGCNHLGVTIELRSKQEHTEKQFLQKMLDLSAEFGGWLIDIKTLQDSIEKGKFHNIDGTYIIEVDAMTVFNASYTKQGAINIEFYIN
jgi:hypothetical protein